MSSWRTVGSVLAGGVVAVGTSLTAFVGLPLLGIFTDVGFPSWLIPVSILGCVVVGGAVAGLVENRSRARGAVVGALAGASSGVLVGAFVGVTLFAIVLGFVPEGGGSPAPWGVPVAAVSGGVGAVLGTVLGGLGGLLGAVGREATRG